MSKHLDPEEFGYGLPYMDKTVANSLLNDKMHDGDANARIWQDLSEHNPYLRDYITMIANRAEPTDLEARGKLIRAMLEPLSALESVIAIQKLDAMWGASFGDKTAKQTTQNQVTKPTLIEPNKAA